MFVLEADGFPAACSVVSKRSGHLGCRHLREEAGGALTREILVWCPENNVSMSRIFRG
jgi:hypothetical protein